MDYEKYLDKVFEKFKTKQDKFRIDYKLDEFDNWFYNSSTELLTLSLEGKEINFKYIPIGTFSSKSNSWMWSWGNSNTVHKQKEAVLKVKEFGVNHNFKKLYERVFEADKFSGWEFTAITESIIESIGAYKITSEENLESYLLLTEHIENSKADKIKEEIIDCEIHGANRVAFVCQHLNIHTKTGFEEAFDSFKGMELSEDDDLQAWCSECEKERLKTNGWNDESMKFANIKLVCEDCYFEIKEFNQS